MKKNYTKPLIDVEIFSTDIAITTSGSIDIEDPRKPIELPDL